MNHEKQRIALIAAVSIIAAIAIIFFQAQITGFFSLAPEQAEPKEETGIGLSAAFEVLKETEIKPKLLSGKLLDCPAYSEIVFEVANFGKTAAERIFIGYPSDFKVKDCTNCKIQQLMAAEKATISFVACKAQPKEIELEFSSINAKKETIKVA